MTTNKAPKAAGPQTSEPYNVVIAERATASEALLSPEALARGHKLVVVPVQRADEFPWYEIPDEYLGRGFQEEHAILEFSGFWKGSGPRWTLYMDDVYADDVYELAGEPEDAPVYEAIGHLDSVRKPIPVIRGSVDPRERSVIDRNAQEHPGDGMLVRRAIAMYVGLKSGSGSSPAYVPKPSSASYVAEHDGQRYVVLHNLNVILAVFRVGDDNAFILQETWPEEIEGR